MSTKARTIAGQGGDVHYWFAGETGAWLAFTHGATMDHGMFAAQVAHFSLRYRVLVWDVPAHGASRPYRDFSLRAAAGDLLAILDQEGVAQAHLAGQSMGGYISQIVALDAPERVRSVTAVDSAPIQQTYYTRLDSWLLALTPTLLMLYPYRQLIRTIADQISVRPMTRDYVLKTLEGMSKAEIAMVMGGVARGLREFQGEFRLPQPVLVVCGDRDRTGKTKDYSSRWAKAEGRELALIPDAAHNANMDNPAAFNAALDAFLETAPG